MDQNQMDENQTYKMDQTNPSPLSLPLPFAASVAAGLPSGAADACPQTKWIKQTKSNKQNKQ